MALAQKNRNLEVALAQSRNVGGISVAANRLPGPGRGTEELIAATVAALEQYRGSGTIRSIRRIDPQ